MDTLRLCQLGFGNVGRRFVELIDERENELSRQFGLRVRFVAIGTAGHGSLLAPKGLTAGEVLARAGAADPRDHSPAHSPGLRFADHARPANDLIAASHADVVVEATTQQKGGAPVAISHLEAALEHGADVITVNKGPIAWDYDRLAKLTRANGRRLRFEGTVMDGTPVFNLAGTTLRGCRVLGFDGVLNSTTNYILDAMGEGESFADALAHVQNQGFAEADPRHDIDGHDAAAKTACLANVLMNARITPQAVERESLDGLSGERIRTVRESGDRLRVICTGMISDLGRVPDLPVLGAVKPARRRPAPLRASVRVHALPPSHPFYSCNGSSSALILHTDLMGDVEIVERDGLVGQTAYAIYSDLLGLHLDP